MSKSVSSSQPCRAKVGTSGHHASKLKAAVNDELVPGLAIAVWRADKSSPEPWKNLRNLNAHSGAETGRKIGLAERSELGTIN